MAALDDASTLALVSRRGRPAGVSTRHLQVTGHSAKPLSTREIRRWLIEQRFAEIRNGRLVPTRLGVRVGGQLDQLG